MNNTAEIRINAGRKGRPFRTSYFAQRNENLLQEALQVALNEAAAWNGLRSGLRNRQRNAVNGSGPPTCETLLIYWVLRRLSNRTSEANLPNLTTRRRT